MKRIITQYLISTFLLSWVSWGIIAIAGVLQINWLTYGKPVGLTLFIIGGISPAICEIILQKRNSRKDEFREFIKNVISIKHSIWIYLYAIGGALLIQLLPVLIGYSTISQPLYLGFLMIIPMIIGGGLEEIGWRGLLQPELESKFSHWMSTLIVSIIWAFWHLPLWFIDGSNQQNMNFGWFSINAVMLSFFIGSVRYIYGSIFMAILAHASINAF